MVESPSGQTPLLPPLLLQYECHDVPLLVVLVRHMTLLVMRTLRCEPGPCCT